MAPEVAREGVLTLSQWAGWSLTEVRALEGDELILWLEGICEIEKARARAAEEERRRQERSGGRR